MPVAHHRAVTLRGFTQDGSNACNLMDDEQQKPPRLFWHASWLLLLGVPDNSEPMIFKPGDHLNHVEPAGVANERTLAPFV